MTTETGIWSVDVEILDQELDKRLNEASRGGSGTKLPMVLFETKNEHKILTKDCVCRNRPLESAVGGVINITSGPITSKPLYRVAAY